MLFFLVSTVSLPALDFGFTLDNSTGFGGDLAADEQFEFAQRDTAALWLDSYLGDHLFVAAQGSYTFTLDEYWFLNPDHLYLKGEWTVGSEDGVVTGFQVGRFQVSEFSGAVLRHILDAASFNIGLPFMQIRVTAGFTGVLFRQRSSILITSQDFTDAGGDGILAPAKLIGIASVKLPELFLRQTVDVAYLTQYDFRFLFDDTIDGSLGTHYAGVGIGGPIVGPLYYSAYGYLRVGNTLDSTGSEILVLSGIGGGRLRIFLRQALDSVITVGGAYSTGDRDAESYTEGSTDELDSVFLPMSTSPFGLVFSPRFGNLALVRVGYSLKPLVNTGARVLRGFQVKVDLFSFFRPVPGPVSEGGIDTASTSRWLGFEGDVRIGFRPLSDLGASLSYGIFIPGTAFEAEADDLRMKLSFDLSLSI